MPSPLLRACSQETYRASWDAVPAAIEQALNGSGGQVHVGAEDNAFALCESGIEDRLGRRIGVDHAVLYLQFRALEQIDGGRTGAGEPRELAIDFVERYLVALGALVLLRSGQPLSPHAEFGESIHRLLVKQRLRRSEQLHLDQRKYVRRLCDFAEDERIENIERNEIVGRNKGAHLPVQDCCLWRYCPLHYWLIRHARSMGRRT